MDSILEDQRKLHEERERLEDALVKEKMLKMTTVSSSLHILIKAHLITRYVRKSDSEHRMRYLIGGEQLNHLVNY